MDFEEFARNFRERAAKRMLEFEVALEESRREMERRDAQRQEDKSLRTQTPRYGVRVEAADTQAEPRARTHGREYGPVQGVLKRN
ncbi:hypothetical protein [Corynebacterium mastitidis]|uniref:hypothetical protein n=1 Tax=Corynebacterium mastitidis TaxID=161890 RepID=UPI00254FB189|nr:hypothetical protein [Corynebacterium mastitidis]MDK8450688.1 hypothetical protein [Corynebacterium mastitidis]